MAAELGSDEGMAEVGGCYLNGDGVKQNDVQAFEWLSRSKDGRYGYYNLAQCYLKGIGTTKNMEKAVACLEMAVNCKCMELSEARRQLVDLYSKEYGGDDVVQKLERVRESIGRGDKLISDLANLIPSEENQ